MEAGIFPAVGSRARPRISGRTTIRIALAGVAALAVYARFAAFGQVPANPYYDAAVRSMGLSWHNFFYGAFEPGGQVSIDKTPVDLWLQVASVKLFGFSSVALRLPEALAGALAVPLLYDLVRRLHGRGAGLVAALALAVLPVAVLTARSDTMDSMMMLLLVGAAWLIVLGAQKRRGWPVVVAGAVVGLAFNVKLFEALVALPALAVLALLAGEVPWRRRAAHLLGAAGALVGVSLAWIATASMAAAGSRPYPIGSTNGSIWNVVFAFNGADRLGKAPSAAVVALDPAGPGRLFSMGGRHYGDLIGVLLAPALLLGLLAVAFWLVNRGRLLAGRSRLCVAGSAFIATWLLTGLVLFSTMGNLRVRYLEAMTPAVAAAVDIAFPFLATAARGRRAAALALAGGAALTAVIAPSMARGAGWATPVALAGATVAVVAALAALRAGPPRPRLTGMLAVGALVAVLAAPLASTLRVASGGASSAQQAGSMPAREVDVLSSYLRSHQGRARYEVASTTVAKSASLIVRDGRPVLMLTSLGGRPLLSSGQLAAAVGSGQVRYLLLGRGTCSPHSRRPCPEVLRWAVAHSTDISRRAGLPRTGTLARLSVAAVR